MSKYDVAIVGAGPAGIFTALELVKRDNLKVLILEKGRDIEKRICPSRVRSYQLCKECALYPCAITSGWGGAGAFSDGKLTLSSEIGGWLKEYGTGTELEQLIDYVDRVYQEFGGPSKRYGTNAKRIESLKSKAEAAGLQLIPAHIKHLGTERCWDVLKGMRSFLEGRAEIKTGVTVELPATIMEPLTKELHESKIIYHSKSFQDKVRTFCMNPHGEVTVETYQDTITVNGHSYADSDKRTKNTNFALLVSTAFTEPFKEPLAYGEYIARLANLLVEGIIIQRLGDLKRGRRSTPARLSEGTVVPTLKEATPGDLSFALPYRYISDILEMIEALDHVAPGIDSDNTLLYGVEVKFYSSRLELKPTMETKIENLYAIGDGAGITRGLIQSSCAGVMAARSILQKIKKRAYAVKQ